MSGTSQQIKVTFSAETSQLLAAIDQVNQKITATTAGVQRAQASASAAHAGLSQAWERTGRAMDLAAKAAVALGVAMAGMKMTEIIKDSTLSAARFETMGVVLGRLAQNTNYSQKQIEQFAVGVQNMGITATGSREVVARMIQAQIDLSQATRLSRVAQDAAVIGNMNSSEALEHLVYGIQSAQVEMLRTLGLNVSFEQSYQRMAASLGKPVEALSDLEKTQARVTAALQAGAGIAGAYEASMGTAGKQLASMQRLVDDLQTKIGAAFLPAFTEGVKGVSQALASINTALDSETGQAALDGIGEAFRKAALASQEFIVPVSVGLGVTFVGAALNAARAIGVVSLATTALSTAFAGWVLPIAAATTALAYFITGQNSTIRSSEQVAAYMARESALRTGNAAATDRQTEAQERLNAARERATTRGFERQMADFQSANDNALKQLRAFGSGPALERLNRGSSRFADADILGAPSTDRGLAFAQYARAFQDFANSAAPVNEAVDQLAARLKALDDAQKRAGQATQFGREEIRAWVTQLQNGLPAVEDLRNRIEGLKTAMKQPGAPAFDLAGSQAAITRTLDALNLKQVGSSIIPEDFAKALSLTTQMADHVERLKAAYAQTQAQIADMTPQTGQWNAKLAEAQGIAQQIQNILSNWPAIMEATGEATAKLMDPWKSVGDDPHYNPLSGGGGGNALAEAQIRAEWAQRIAEAEADGAHAVREAQAAMERLIAASQGGTSLAEAAAKAREAEATALGQAVAHARILSREAQQGIAMSLALLQGPEAAAALARQQERDRLTRLVGPGQTGAIGQGVAAFDAQQAAAAASAMSQIGVEAQKAAAIARVEMGYIGASNSERERAVALEQLRLQYVEAIAKAGDNEALKEQLASINAQAEASINALAGVKAQLERTQQIQDAMKQASDAIGSAFEAAIVKGDKLTDVLKSLEQTLLQIFAKQFIFKPLTDMLGNFAGSLFGTGGGVESGSIPFTFSAQGNVFGGGALSSYRNSFVTQPTVFPFAKGGAVGLMGEAGTEAIFPVFRTRNGDLGVKVGNDNAPGGASGGGMQVNIFNSGGQQVTTEQRQQGDMTVLDVMIDKAVSKNIRTAGTNTARSLSQTYGAQRRVIRR